MRFAIIGYRNHAARLRGLLADIEAVSEIIVFHPDSDRLRDLEADSAHAAITATSDFDQLRDCAGVLISSPSDSHRQYIEQLLRLGDMAIFCEKPIATTPEDLNWLRKLPTTAKRRLFCNQSYAHNAFSRQAAELIESGRAGQPRHLEINATHGLAFNPSFEGNWRFRTRDPFASIVGNLGVHYVYLVLRLFGEPDRIICHKSRGNPNSVDADTCAILMTLPAGQSVSIYVSYATPFTNTARLLFTDGILHLDDGCLRLYSPRDSFDADGRYATPPHEEICRFDSYKAFADQSLQRALRDFVAGLDDDTGYSEEAFAMAIRSAELVLQMYGDEPT